MASALPLVGLIFQGDYEMIDTAISLILVILVILAVMCCYNLFSVLASRLSRRNANTLPNDWDPDKSRGTIRGRNNKGI